MAAIGIDFGSSNISAAAWIRGAPEIQKNTCGDMKSVAFVVQEGQDTTYAQEARSQSSVDTTSAVFDVKQFLGLNLEESQELAKLHLYPFNFERSKDGNVCFVLDGGYKIPVVTIAEMLFRRTKIESSRNLEKNIEHCTLTLSSSWTANQIALGQAAMRAELSSLKFIDSQVAAVMGCFLHTLNAQTFCRNIILVDVGATGIAATVFKTDNEGRSSMGETIAMAGKGGNAVDRKLIRLCQDIFEKTHGFEIDQEDMKAIHRLRLECQDAKIRMTTTKNTTISVTNLYCGKDFIYLLDQKTFEEICEEFAHAAVVIIRSCLREADLKTNDDYQILLVGGASRLPAIRRRLKETFIDHLNPSVLLYPEMATVYGAAGIARLWETWSELPMENIIKHYRLLSQILRFQDVPR